MVEAFVKTRYACLAAMSVAMGCVALENVHDVIATQDAGTLGSDEGPRTAAELPAIEFGQIPAGMFTMGSPPDEEGRAQEEDGGYDEGPQHEVSVSAFELGKYEVTNAQYERFVDTHPEFAKPWNWDATRPSDPAALADWGALPATGINWDEAVRFANWIGARLPTEAEWEYAARAGTIGNRYGDALEVAWFEGNSRGVKHAVGTKQGNDWGLYDMLGNVYEFCADRYAYYESGPAADPKGPTFGATRVVRSGSFSDLSNFARAAARGESGRGWRAGDYGLRLARSHSDGK